MNRFVSGVSDFNLDLYNFIQTTGNSKTFPTPDKGKSGDP